MATVTAHQRSGMQTSVSARQFTWSADEPPAAGGTDTGPTPYELLLGGLAACTAITLRWYADRKELPLDGVDVSLEFDRIHAADCEECESAEKGLIDRIRSHVTIHGSFDDGQRARLEQIVERCPVHKSLARGIEIFDAVTFEDT